MKTSFVVAAGIVVMSFSRGKVSEAGAAPAGVPILSTQRCGRLKQKDPVTAIMTGLHLNPQAATELKRTMADDCRNQQAREPGASKVSGPPLKLARARLAADRITSIHFDDREGSAAAFPASRGGAGSAALPRGSDAASSRENPCRDYDELCEQSRKARPTVSVIGGAGGVDKNSIASFGSLVRVPLLPWIGKSNKHGNFGIELGALWSGHKGSNTSLSSKVLDSYSAKPNQLSIGDWSINDDVNRLTKSFTQVEFLGMGYQTPWIAKRLSFEAGMRLAGISHDPRATTKEAVSKNTYKGENYCNPSIPNSCPESCYTDSWGKTTCTTDYNYHTSDYDVQVLDQKTLSITSGTPFRGVGGVAYAATNFLLANHFGLKFEADRTFAKGVNANSYRGGLVFRF